MMATAPLPISLFQLSAEAWLSSQAVAQAVRATEAAQLLPWAQEATDSIGEDCLGRHDHLRLRQIVGNLDRAVQDGNVDLAHRSREKLAKIVHGIKDEGRWSEVVCRAEWHQGVSKIFIPDTQIPWEASFLFAGSDSSDPTAFEKWTESKKRQLYDLTKETISKSFGKKVVYPSYQEFLRFVRLGIRFSDLNNLSEILDPHSLFNQLSMRVFYQHGWHADEGESYYYDDEPIYFYDILAGIVTKPKSFNTPADLMERAHRALLNGRADAIEVFIHNLSRSSFKRHIEVAVALLEEGVGFPEITDKIVSLHDPRKAYQEFRTYLEEYRGNHNLDIASYNPHSQIQDWALYVATGELFEKSREEGQFFPNFSEFLGYFWTEFQLAQLRQIPLSLEELARKIAKQQERFTPGIIWKTYWELRMYEGNYHEPYKILAWFMAKFPDILKELIFKVDEIVFQNRYELNEAFNENQFAAKTPEELRAAVELLDTGFPLTGRLFRRYAAAADRAQKMEATKARSRELAAGAPLGSMDDPFEVMAVWRVLGVQAPLLSTVLTIIEQAEIPDRSANVYFEPFTIPSVPLIKPFFTVVNKGSLEKYAQEIRDVSTLNGLVNTLKNFTGNREARRAIQKYLDELERIPDANTLKEVQLRKEEGEAIEIIWKISEAITQWLLDRTEYLVGDGNQMDREKAREQAVREIDVYLKNILIAKGLWSSVIEPEEYDKREAGQEETYRALDQLSEFYHSIRELPEWAFSPHQPFPWPPSLDKIFNGLDKMNDDKKMLQKTGESKNITLSPITGKLAALYGYLSENCLARSDWAVHAMRDPGFVPYFILVDGECQGVVQTFTKVVTVDGVKKKILIVTGVDPQLRFTPDPSVFIRGLEAGFSWWIAAVGDYDLVVVPTLDFAQSSRRKLLRSEFTRYTEKIRIDEPIGFPQVGVHEDGRPIYYHNEAHGEARHQEFLVFRSQKL